MAAVYTMCGYPAWSDAACQKCDSCREQRANLRRVLSASQEVVGAYDFEKAALHEAVERLRNALEWKRLPEEA